MKRLFLSLSFLMLLGGMAQAGIVYINASATGANDGSSWTDAHTSINFSAFPGDSIFIAAGTYKPITGSELTFNAEFHIYGGFPNTGNPTWVQRDWDANPTIIDGDVNGDDGTYAFTDNAKRLFNCNANCTIDGFTFRNGGNNTEQLGAAILMNSAKGRIANCIFENNRVLNASQQFAGAGGAIQTAATTAQETDTMYIDNCIFRKNYAAIGGAINSEKNLVITNSKFADNTALNGPAIAMKSNADDLKDDISLYVEQCLFARNGKQAQNPAISLFTERSGADGSTIYFNSNFCTYYKEMAIIQPTLNNPSNNFNFMTLVCTNNIVDIDSALHAFSQTANIYDVDVNHPSWGAQITVNSGGRNMINYVGANPSFEVHLPNWAITDSANLEYVLDCTSWGVDSAATTTIATDINGNSRVNGTAADMGAFESTCGSVPNAIRSLTVSHGIKIYPNPTSNLLHVELGNATITNSEVIDITGKKIKSFQPNQSLEVGELPEGIYILRLFTNQGVVHKRFIKQ